MRTRSRLKPAAALHLAAVLLTGCPDAPRGRTALVPDVSDFEIPAGPGSVAGRDFTLTNMSRETVRVAEITPSCGCAMARVDRTEIPPGESTTLRVGMHRPGIGYQKVDVQIDYAPQPTKPLVLHLKCWASDSTSRVVDAAPRFAVIRDTDGGECEIRIRTLELAAERLIRSAECDVSYIVIAEIEVSESPGPASEYVERRYRFQAMLTDDYPYGQFQAKAIFRLAPSAAAPREFVVPIEVTTVAPIYADPEVLFASVADRGDLPCWDVEIRRRRTQAAWHPADVVCECDWLSAEVAASRGEREDERSRLTVGGIRVQVTKLPPGGESRAEVIVRGVDGDSQVLRIPVVLSRHGT